MKKNTTLLYIPLVILFALAITVLAVHYRNLFGRLGYSAQSARLPFTSGTIVKETPETKEAGLKIGDTLVAVNGREITEDEVYYQELSKLRADEPAVITVSRKNKRRQRQD